MITLRISVALAVLTTLLSAQQRGEPIDFMTIVIEGKEMLYLPKSLVKQAPEPPAPYTKRELDSINPLEKTPLFRSEPLQYSRQIFPPLSDNLALIAQTGLYGFATLDALYQTQIEQYVLDLRGTLDRGGPYRPNADYFRTRLTAIARTASHSAPDTHRMMGNGMVDIQTWSYRLFAIPQAPERLVRTASLMLEQKVDGSRLPYHASVEVQNVNLRHMDSATTDETEIRARARTIPWHIGSMQLGAQADFSLRNYRGTTLHFHTVTVTGAYSDSMLAVDAQLGAQLGTTSWRSTEFSPLADIGVQWRIVPWAWIESRIRSWNTPVYFRDQFAHCPYVTDSAAIGVKAIPYQLNAGISIVPNSNLLFAANVHLCSYSSAPYFDPIGDGTFVLRYSSWNERWVELSGRYSTNQHNYLRGRLRFLDAALHDGSRVPYQPTWTVDMEYGTTPSERLMVAIRSGYVSARRGGTQNTGHLSGYFIIAGRGEYRLNDTFSVTVTVDNLAGSIIELWQGYLERGRFVAIGLAARF